MRPLFRTLSSLAALLPAAALALDASRMPPPAAKEVEAPSLRLGGAITCTGAACPTSGLSATAPGASDGLLLADWLKATSFSVPTVTALRGWPISPLTAGAHMRTSGYYAAADGGGGHYVWDTAATGHDDGCLIIRPRTIAESAAGRWRLQLTHGGELSAAACGVKADFDYIAKTGTDNTAAMRAAMKAASGYDAYGTGLRLVLPPGGILTGPLVVDGQINIVGASEQSTLLVLMGTATTALFTVKTVGEADFPKVGYPAGRMSLRDFRITSQYGRADSRTNGNASGIRFLSGKYQTWIEISDVWFYSLGGAGIEANGVSGFVECTRCTFHQNRIGTYTQYSVDWRFIDCDWALNAETNLKTVVDGQMVYYNPNIYGSPGYGVVSLGSDMKVYGGDMSFNGKSGLYISGDPLTGPGGNRRVNLVGTTNFGLNGFSAPGQYADIEVYGSGTALNVSQARFTQKPRSQYVHGDTNRSNIKNNIYVDAAATATITLLDGQFESGSLDAPDVTNARAKIRALSVGPYTPYTPTFSGGSGSTVGSLTGAYQVTGKRMNAEINLKLTDAGRASVGFYKIALPPGFVPARNGAGAAFNIATSQPMSAQLIAGDGFVYVRNTAGSYQVGANQIVNVNLSYEIQ